MGASLADLIRQHWRLPTADLLTIIGQHYPALTAQEIIAELCRVGAEAEARADELAMTLPAEGPG